MEILRVQALSLQTIIKILGFNHIFFHFTSMSIFTCFYFKFMFSNYSMVSNQADYSMPQYAHLAQFPANNIPLNYPNHFAQQIPQVSHPQGLTQQSLVSHQMQGVSSQPISSQLTHQIPHSQSQPLQQPQTMQNQPVKAKRVLKIEDPNTKEVINGSRWIVL